MAVLLASKCCRRLVMWHLLFVQCQLRKQLLLLFESIPLCLHRHNHSQCIKCRASPAVQQWLLLAAGCAMLTTHGSKSMVLPESQHFAYYWYEAMA